MFGFQKQQNKNIPILNTIGTNTLIEGTIKAEGDLRIDGIVIGNISTNKRLVTGAMSEIEGDVICQNGFVNGMIKGTLRTTETLRLGPSAVVNGSIFANKLIIDLGAVIHAKINMKAISDEIAPRMNHTIPAGYTRKAITKKVDNKVLLES
jgi:cytoskeletal protein CcmA (bactofilin family)